jgi:hypothetical protein
MKVTIDELQNVQVGFVRGCEVWLWVDAARRRRRGAALHQKLLVQTVHFSFNSVVFLLYNLNFQIP